MEKKIIVTHNGSFHVDDVFAVTLLREMLGKDFEVEIVRSRDPEDFERGDYVVDVGGVYDASKQRFDHHQEGRAGARDNGIFYSSLGLVWKEYGEIVCGSKEVADIVEERLVIPVDAHDNGIVLYEEKYENIFPYGIQNVIEVMRPSWNEADRDYDKNFFKATELAKIILEREILHAKGFIDGSKRIREQVLEQGADEPVVEVDHNFPWETVIRKEFPNIKFVIFQHDTGNWQIKTISDSRGHFTNRALLPEEWRGKTNEDLAKTSGVEDATFCHPAGFTGGAKSREGVFKMAQIALGM